MKKLLFILLFAISFNANAIVTTWQIQAGELLLVIDGTVGYNGLGLPATDIYKVDCTAGAITNPAFLPQQVSAAISDIPPYMATKLYTWVRKDSFVSPIVADLIEESYVGLDSASQSTTLHKGSGIYYVYVFKEQSLLTNPILMQAEKYRLYVACDDFYFGKATLIQNQ